MRVNNSVGGISVGAELGKLPAGLAVEELRTLPLRTQASLKELLMHRVEPDTRCTGGGRFICLYAPTSLSGKVPGTPEHRIPVQNSGELQ